MTAAAPLPSVPSLTLVRPLREPAGKSTDASADTPSLSLSPVRTLTDEHAPDSGARPSGLGSDGLSRSSGPNGSSSSDGPSAESGSPPSARPLAPDDRTLLESMAPALATALVEVLVGARAPVSIEKWVEAPLFERIVEHTRVRQSLTQSNPHTDRPLTTSRVRVCEVSESVVEIALVVTTTRRPRALALRLTRRRSRWRLSEFLSI